MPEKDPAFLSYIVGPILSVLGVFGYNTYRIHYTEKKVDGLITEKRDTDDCKDLCASIERSVSKGFERMADKHNEEIVRLHDRMEAREDRVFDKLDALAKEIRGDA